MAPTLSKVPIFVRPFKEQPDQRRLKSENPSHPEAAEKSWSNDLDELEQDEDEDEEREATRCGSKVQGTLKTKAQLDAIFSAAQKYIHRAIKIDNIAHSSQPIRLASIVGQDDLQPSLDVSTIVVGPPEGDDGYDGVGYDRRVSESEATIKLLRMVNDIPMMDGAEASACGLVQGLPNKMVWGAFGIQVSFSSNSNDLSWIPTFDVQDSPQLAHFFQGHTHAMFEARDGDVDGKVTGSNKKRKSNKEVALLPARIRLGEVIVIAHIHAEPSSLPLPTLSKVS
jgi:hypothetical protein